MTNGDRSKESFVRWNGIAREQLGKTSDLTLGLTTALLAFNCSWLIEQKFCAGWPRSMAIASVVVLGITIAIALACATTRLHDFRKTATIARDRGNLAAEALHELRDDVGNLGRWTWRLFYAQLVTFACGVICGALAAVTQAF